MTKQYLPTDTIHTVTDYPYGRLQCEMSFSMEFTKRGFRTVRQSVNPKTGRINKPKKSTYSPLMFMFIDSETGHVKYNSYELNGNESINTAMTLMGEQWVLFSEEQQKHLLQYTLMALVGSMKAQVIYCNSKFEDLKPLYDNVTHAIAVALKDGNNPFKGLQLDVESINNTKEEGYQPFRVVQVA